MIAETAIMINCAYKKGISRVGCIMCPESSARYVWFAQKIYPQIVKTYSDIIIGTSAKNFNSVNEKNEFVGSIDWGARKSGVVLKDTLTNPLEEHNELSVTFQSPHFSKDLFYEWIKTLGAVVKERGMERQRLKFPNSLDNGIPFTYIAPYTGGGTAIFEFRDTEEKTVMLPLLRAFLRKVSGCVACRSCETECLHGAITTKDGKLKVSGDKCVKCRKCYDIEKDCWRFKSMFKSENDNDKMSGINRYNHFGLREDWIAPLVDLRGNFFPWTETHPLGSKMVQSASAWFQQALLIQNKTRNPSPLVEIFAKYGSSYMLGWEFIWIALANNTILSKQHNSNKMVHIEHRNWRNILY